jgi:hypothetical protein
MMPTASPAALGATGTWTLPHIVAEIPAVG